MKLMKFATFCLLEDRVDYVKKINPEIDSSHDVYATHRDPGDIVNHFATHADPTPKKTHTQWIVNQYKKGNFRQEDHPRIKTALEGFEKYKGKLEKKDINQYKSLSDVENAVEPHMGKAASHKEEKRQVKSEGAELVHSENGLTVHRLDTHAAACAYGAGTKWCTASKNDDRFFKKYSENGPLYVVQTPNKQKYQFHMPSRSFMDAKDRYVKPEDMVKKHPELRNVAAFKDPEHIESLKFVSSEQTNDHLDRMTTAKNFNSRVEAASMSSEHAGKLVNDPDWRVRSEVAQRKEHAGKLINDPSRDVRYAVAGHPEHAGGLLPEKVAFIRQRIAMHREHAGKLIDDPNRSVRIEVAKHPEHAGKLVNDPDPYVRGTAMGTLGLNQ